MNRLHGSGYRETIQAAKALLTPRMNDRLMHLGFVCGVSPVFIGMNWPETARFNDGSTASYAEIASTGYGRWHVPDKQTTVVLPKPKLVDTVLHELGHALHETVDWLSFGEKTTAYSRENSYEEFAEAFETWAYRPHGWEHLPAVAPQYVALFEALSA